MSNADIASTVKLSMQETFDTDPSWVDFDLHVLEVTVVNLQGNSYKGFAEVLWEDDVYPVAIDVIADGYDVLWEAPPESFEFIAQSYLQPMQDIFLESMREVGEALQDY